MEAELGPIAPRILVLAPLAEERSILLKACQTQHAVEFVTDPKLPCAYVPERHMALAEGGHGKTQFAVRAQYLIDRFPSASLIVCVGAAGSLDARLSVGDVVVGTDTVEHDFRLLFATRPLPRFPGDNAALALLRRADAAITGFRVTFGVIASGDEDVVTSERAAEIRAQTSACCVAWEGSGAARAAAFNGIGSLEIRGITDAADREAPRDFEQNLPIAMANVFKVIELLSAMYL
jgi:adenosylhomocysteine nucleosidase